MNSAKTPLRRRIIMSLAALCFGLTLAALIEGGLALLIRVGALHVNPHEIQASPDVYELVSRLYQPDRELFWAPIPGFRGVYRNAAMRINSIGLRDDEFANPKPDNEFRIMAIGDSCTFGFGMEQEKTYVQRLETLLNQRPGRWRFQVINGGIEAYTTHQGLKLLQRYAPLLQPDVLIVYFTGNDGSSCNSSLTWDYGATEQGPMEAVISGFYRPGFSDREIDAINHSRWIFLSDWIRKTYAGRLLRQALRETGLLPRPCLRDGEECHRVYQEERLENFQSMTEYGDRRGITVLFVRPPAPSYAGWLRGMADSPLGEAARSDGFAINLQEALAFRCSNLDPLFMDTVHPNETGHDFIAQELLHYLVQRGLAP